MKTKLLTLAFLLALGSPQANAQKDKTPLMGWSSWNTFLFHISDSIICTQADAMVSTGLHRAGYTYVNIDDGFFGGRDDNGRLIIHPTRFPHGLKPVVDHIHSLGLKAGIYSDAGRNTCSGFFSKEPTGQGVGLYGHDREDCHFFFDEMDFDFIKIDYCGGFAKNNSENLQLCERDRYAEIFKAINDCKKKDIRINACRWEYPGTWIGNYAGSWRTTHDIACQWRNVADIIGQNLYLSAYASPGHFNDMDMLEVGRGLSVEEDKTHFALWCIMSSPLLIGCDMTKMSDESKALMTNPRLIALNQDTLGLQAYPTQCVSGCHVLVKDVEQRYGTKRAVAIYNPRGEVKNVRLSLADIDLAGKVRVTDCYTGMDVSKQVKDGVLTIPVIPTHGTAVFTIEAEQRLDQTYYEAEAAYNPSYQELTNNQAARTGWYEYDGNCRSDMKASWLGGNEDNCLVFRNVRRSKAGMYDITIGYLTNERRVMNLEVNGKHIGKIVCDSTDKVKTITMHTSLNEGNNVIRLYNNQQRMPDIDYVKVTATTTQQSPAEKDMAGYVMVYHKDADHGLHMAYSWDGYKWTALNNDKPIMAGDTIAVQKGIRDPYIFRAPDGSFCAAMTDLHIFAKRDGLRQTEWERDGKKYDWGNNRGLVLLRSRDLIHWQRTNLDISSLTCSTGVTDGEGNALPWSEMGCAWAPEMIVDDNGRILLHFTTRFQRGRNHIRYVYMSDDFSCMTSDPEVLFTGQKDDKGNITKHIIDSDITRFGNRYHLFCTEHGHPRHAVSDSLTGPYSFVPFDDGVPQSHEAPMLWKLIGQQKWMLMQDRYSITPHNFYFVETTDMEHFTPLGYFDDGKSPFTRTNFAEQKHGAVMQVTKKELKRLIDYWKKK